MNSLLLWFLFSSLGLLAIASIVTFFAVRNAPEGCEDGDGFHASTKPDREIVTGRHVDTNPGFAH